MKIERFTLNVKRNGADEMIIENEKEVYLVNLAITLKNARIQAQQLSGEEKEEIVKKISEAEESVKKLLEKYL